MTEKPKNGTILYLCECGKKWTFKQPALNKDSEQECTCGRAIVIYKGGIYSEWKK